MNTKPRLIDYIFLGLAVLCFLGTLIFVIVKYPSLPDMLPSHFNARGEIDGWSGKASAAFFPSIVGFLMLAIMGPIQFFPQVWNNTQGVPAYKLPRVIRSTRTGLCLMLFVLEAFFAATAVCTVRQTAMPAFVTYLFMTITGGSILFILVQTFRK